MLDHSSSQTLFLSLFTFLFKALHKLKHQSNSTLNHQRVTLNVLYSTVQALWIEG
jgi:hypothetical protein